MSRENNLLQQVIKTYSKEDRNLVLKAFSFAKEAHKGQKRLSGEDYIIHPLRIVNCLVFELSIKNTDLIIASILHDVVEDSNTTIKESLPGKGYRPYGRFLLFQASSICLFLFVRPFS